MAGRGAGAAVSAGAWDVSVGVEQDASSSADTTVERRRPHFSSFIKQSSHGVAKATGAGVVIFPGGSHAGPTFEFEGTQQASFFVDHGIAAFVAKYRIPSDLT